METTLEATPTSRLRWGAARADITPPVGIYHRMWGAARHDRATGVHRPLVGDVIVLAPLAGDGPALVRAHLDMVGLAPAQHQATVAALADSAGVGPERVVLTYSHTHAGGVFGPERRSLPGGELIDAHLERVRAALADACRQAKAAAQPAVISYATARCALAVNRDCWDADFGGYVCGYNPGAPADDTLVAARVTGEDGRILASLVNYACHPTTLAWDNTLISPDYTGALRETVERETDAPCIFANGACGDLAPKRGYVGDPAVADANGRQVAYAALAALASLGPAGSDFAYAGPVISGATLGTWADVPQGAARAAETARFAGGSFSVDLPLKPRPDPAALRAEQASWEERQREAQARGAETEARDYGARAERAWRWLGRLAALPEGENFPFPFSVYRLGDAIWATSGGEPYSQLQLELRRRFPGRTILFSPLAGGESAAYLLPADRYGRGLYQEEPSILAPGCLERLTDAIAAEIAALV